MNERKSLILMVEDEEQVLNTNCRMLQRRGYDVRTAQTVSEVCHQLEEQLPDLLILDIMLPDGNGLDICRHFREKTMNPVLFLTGKSDIRDKVEGLQQGGDYYLTKPYNFDEFLAVIQMLLERQKRIEEKIKEKAIVELIQNPTEEIKKSVIEQIPVEQKENIIEEEIEIIKNELKKDPKFIQMCQNRAMSENEKLEELEMQIENLKGKKNYIEESIAELEIHHKKQRKQLAEEFEREKQRNNARIIEMQNTTIEQEKDKPSFWNKIADKIFNFKIVATVSFVMYQLSNKVPPERILKNVKHFRKNYDKYVENPELIQRELKTMEYMDIGLSKIEESEKIDLNKEKSRDDYDLEL